MFKKLYNQTWELCTHQAFRRINNFRLTNGDRAIIHIRNRSCFGSRKKTNHLLQYEKECWWLGNKETNGRWRGRTRVAKHVRRVTHVSNITGICSPINKGENTPRVQNATSGPVNSQALSWHVPICPPPPSPRNASMLFVRSKESTDSFFF